MYGRGLYFLEIPFANHALICATVVSLTVFIFVPFKHAQAALIHYFSLRHAMCASLTRRVYKARLHTHLLSHFVFLLSRHSRLTDQSYLYNYCFKYNQLSFSIRHLFHIAFPKTLAAAVCYLAVVYS